MSNTGAMSLISNSLLVVVLYACSSTDGGPSCPQPQPSGLPSGQILAWDVSQGLWGRASLTLDADGKLSYGFQSVVPQSPAEKGQAWLEPAEMQRVVDTLLRDSVCGICRLRNGIPDEAIPVLRVRASNLDCRVEAWGGEWRERAPEVDKLMKDLTARTQPAPVPQPEPSAPPPTPMVAVDAGARPEEQRHELLLRAEQLLKERHKIGQQQNAAKCLDGTRREAGTCPKGPPGAVVAANRKAWKALLAELGDDPEVPDLKRRWRDTTIEGRYKPKYK